MKKLNSRTYLYIAAVGFLLIIGLTVFYAFTPVSRADSTQYLYIDDDDTQDSVIMHLRPMSHTAGLTGLSSLLRHSSYGDNVRSGRYAIEPNEGAFALFRKLKNGQQASLRLTIPEVRTMDRLASVLAKKLMLDSTTIANALYSNEVCQKYGYDTCTVATLFVPNTYDVYWNMSIDALMQRMEKEHNRFWQGDREAKAAQLQLRPV